MVSVFSGSLGETGFLCAGWYNGRNWLATGWMGRTDRMGRGWGGSGMNGPKLAGAGSVAPTLSLEFQARVSGRWRQEAVADTNCVDDLRVRSICVRPEE